MRDWICVSGFMLIALLVAFSTPGNAQTRDGDIRYRLAQSYERSGDFEAAVKIYRELYTKEPLNLVVMEALKRGLLQLKRYDDAIALIQQSLTSNPRDFNQLAQLGSIYIQKSDEKLAWEAWERAIAVEPKREITYRVVGNYIVQGRLFEKAIELYRRARIACADPTLFSNDIAYLYSIILKYPEATAEYISQIRQNPGQLGYVQSRISSYTGRPEGLEAAIRIVNDVTKSEPGNVSFQKLLAWLLMEGKQFDRAYVVYTSIDDMINAGGRELFQFAEHALKEKAFDVASRAYSDIIGHHPNFEYSPQAKFGYARTLEELGALSDTLRRIPTYEKPITEPSTSYAGVITAYNAVIMQYPRSEIAARSLLRIAIIRQERFFDLDAARSTLESIERSFSMYPQVFLEAKLRLGDVHLMLGDLQKAEEHYSSLAGQIPLVGEERERAALHLAELDYLRGKFNESVEKLKPLLQNTHADIANDAIALQIFVQENLKEHEAALKEFAKADLLRRQRKLPQALAAFESVSASFPEAPLVAEALLHIGDIHARMLQPARAIASYERLVNEFPESLSLDRALVNIGRTYENGLNDHAKAIAAYQSLLEKYPNSIYAGEARRRVRELRGDNI